MYGPVVWSFMVPYGPIWTRMVLYGPVWSQSVLYGPQTEKTSQNCHTVGSLYLLIE